MKIRQGFVSNSSSSSFIVIGDTGYDAWEVTDLDTYELDENGNLVIGDAIGTTEFGWGPEALKKLGDRINLAWVDVEGTPNQEIYNASLLKALQSRRPDIKGLVMQSRYAYVDHQSQGMVRKAYQSQEILERFLFDSGSRIVLDNDNN